MAPKRRVTLVHNASAGDSDHEPRELIDTITAAGYAVTYCNPKECDLESFLDDHPGDVIAVAGGDGTIRNVAIAAKADGPPMAILPLGTANNIASSLHLEDSLQDLIAGWKTARLKNFYPIELVAPWGRQRLMEGVGFGRLPKSSIMPEMATSRRRSRPASGWPKRCCEPTHKR
jgi:hypothetical protein